MGRLEEASLVLLFGREAERELGVGAREPSVDIEMARLDGRGTAVLRRDGAGEHRRVCRLVAPLPGIDVRLIEAGVLRIRGHGQGAMLVALRVGHIYPRVIARWALSAHAARSGSAASRSANFFLASSRLAGR